MTHENLHPDLPAELREVDALMDRLAAQDRAETPDGLASRVFFASARDLPASRTARTGWMAWGRFAVAAAVVAAMGVLFVGTDPITTDPSGDGRRTVTFVGSGESELDGFVRTVVCVDRIENAIELSEVVRSLRTYQQTMGITISELDCDRPLDVAMADHGDQPGA